MTHAAHHASRKTSRQSPYLKAINKLVLLMAVVEPLFTLPQAYNVWILRETAGVSIATWGFFAFAAVVWLLYGLAIKNTPLIISSTLWVLLEGSLVVGLIVR